VNVGFGFGRTLQYEVASCQQRIDSKKLNKYRLETMKKKTKKTDLYLPVGANLKY
jgi:hypothetical protein